jgi:hypothetical protein
VLGDGRREGERAGAQLVGRQLRRLPGRAVGEVRRPDPVGEQLLVLVRREPTGGEAREVQDGPEAVAGPREVASGGGGGQRGVDPDEEDPQAGREEVRYRLAGVQQRGGATCA